MRSQCRIPNNRQPGHPTDRNSAGKTLPMSNITVFTILFYSIQGRQPLSHLSALVIVVILLFIRVDFLITKRQGHLITESVFEYS